MRAAVPTAYQEPLETQNLGRPEPGHDAVADDRKRALEAMTDVETVDNPVVDRFS